MHACCLSYMLLYACVHIYTDRSTYEYVSPTSLVIFLVVMIPCRSVSCSQLVWVTMILLWRVLLSIVSNSNWFIGKAPPWALRCPRISLSHGATSWPLVAATKWWFPNIGDPQIIQYKPYITSNKPTITLRVPILRNPQITSWPLIDHQLYNRLLVDTGGAPDSPWRWEWSWAIPGTSDSFSRHLLAGTVIPGAGLSRPVFFQPIGYEDLAPGQGWTSPRHGLQHLVFC